MYHERAGAIMASGLKPNARLVLLAISHHLGSNETCWPGLARLAHFTGLTDRSVRRILRELEGTGLLSVDSRPGQSSVYTVRWDDLPRTKCPPGHYVPPDTVSPPPRTLCPPTPDTVSPKGFKKDSLEGNPPVVPPGDTPQPPVEKSSKPKRRRAALSLEQIAAVEVPAELASLDGFTERWLEYAEHRQSLKVRWKSPDQPGRMLRKLCRDAGKGLDVVTALEESTANGYQGVFPKPPRSAPAAKDIRQTAERLWQRIESSLADVNSTATPGPNRAWRLFPEDDALETAVLDAIQTATATSSHGFAWRALRQRRNDFERRKLIRDFSSALSTRRAA